LEQIVRSLGALNHRLDKMERVQQTRNDEAERVQRKAQREAIHADTIERQARFASFQARADDALEAFSVRAPAPVAGESARDYAIRVLELAQAYIPPSNPLANISLSRCDDATLNVFRPQIFEAVEAAAWSTESVPEGEMAERVSVDPNTGAKQRHFIGERSFVRDFTAQNQRARIRDPSEFLGRGFH
jgi:hypothetical protein